MSADRANFSDANLSGCMLMNVSFIAARLVQANLSSAHIQNCNFFETDFSGASLRKSQLVGRTILDAVKFDDQTSFDGATGSRALSRLPVLGDYAYEGGRFRSSCRGR
jgi:uncharacterized protein YjbI with pentapeptide repeats